jgi:hypothetical protein
MRVEAASGNLMPAQPQGLVGGAARPGLQQPMAMPGSSAATSFDLEARRKEFERRRDEMQLALIANIAQLKAGFGAPLFAKFDAYLHQLYASAGYETSVPMDEGEAGEQGKKKTPVRPI